MADLAIATHADQPGLTADDELLGEALTRQGVTWTAVPWTSAEADWSRYGAVLIRSTWDYHEKTRAFLAWIASLDACGTIVWNGPVGVFEFDQFAGGTKALAEAIAQSKAFSIAGGGDTLAAIAKFGVTDQIGYISTGGGAFLEFLEGKELPAVAALEKRGA